MADSKTHIKPTPEELLEENEKILAELENSDDSTDEVDEADDEEEETPEETVSETPEETPVDTEEPQEQTEEETPEVEPPKEPDYKKKFSESSREAQKISAKNRKLNEAITTAKDIDEPTEEELAKEYADWDVLDDTTKKIARDSYISSKRFKLVIDAAEEAKKIEKWGEDVESYAENPQTLIDHPALEGKVEGFKAFASKDENTNIPFNILVTSFLYEESQKPKQSKGKMFPDGSGGPSEKPKPKSDKISVEESEQLRKTDYKKYLEFLKAGKIADLTI